ncbi:MAG: flavin reductase family protein [Myxococcales bacterium]|nr:flavin reductase family protein [Myxococcales bacterium]
MNDEQNGDLASRMRAGMRKVAQGVSVVSLGDRNDQRAAMTASSVTSVSAEPPSMLVCVHRDASLYAGLSASKPFCINALASHMDAIANRCAGGATGDDRFAEGDWQTDPQTGLPFLADALANFFCTPEAALQYGTHLVCIGRVDSVRVTAEREAPLLYLAGGYGTFTSDR